MLELDDPRWAQLSHAYGHAADVPDVLRQIGLAAGPAATGISGPWFTLWSSLCHQGDVFEASYAAVPHLVTMACTATRLVDFSFFQLPVAIEIGRNNGQGPQMPGFLAEAYFNAVSRLTEAVARHREAAWDQPMLISALAAQAVAKGHHKVAEAIMNLDDDVIGNLIALDLEA